MRERLSWFRAVIHVARDGGNLHLSGTVALSNN